MSTIVLAIDNSGGASFGILVAFQVVAFGIGMSNSIVVWSAELLVT